MFTYFTPLSGLGGGFIIGTLKGEEVDCKASEKLLQSGTHHRVVLSPQARQQQACYYSTGT